MKACNGLFRHTTAPHSKSNMDNLNKALKSNWKHDKVSKYIYPVLVAEEEVTEEAPETENNEGEQRLNT